MDRIDEEMIDAETWQIRAALCELLALSFRYPDGELVDAIASGEWVEAARELAACGRHGHFRGFCCGAVRWR